MASVRPRQAAFVLASIVLLAGCVALPGDGATVTPELDLLPAFPQEHDHLDPALHGHAQGLRLLGSHTLVPDNASRGDWMTSEIVIRGGYAFVAYTGAPWLLAVVDIADPAAPKLVGQLDYANAWGMDVAASDDGQWVYVGVYPHAVGELFTRGYVLDHFAPPNAPSTPGIAVVDVRDPTAPRLGSFLPTPGFGPHTLFSYTYPEGREVVFAEKADLNVGNSILISEVVSLPTGGRILRPIANWMLDGPVDPDQPHDVDVQLHPITGQTLLYVANTWAGVTIVDVSDPTKPTTIYNEPVGVASDPDALVHDIHPYPELIDGRHYTVAAPEIITGETTGTVRVFDTTDPTAPVALGTWEMAGDHITAEPFGFSTHNFVYMDDGRIALAHGHAGVWILDWMTDMSAPRAVAYYAGAFPDAAPPTWAPVHGTPWYWGTAIDEKGNLWASDSMGGIVSLAEA